MTTTRRSLQTGVCQLASVSHCVGRGVTGSPKLGPFQRLGFQLPDEPTEGRTAMKQSRFTEEPIAHALRQAEAGTPAVEVGRKLGVSEPTVSRGKRQFAGMGVVELRRRRQIEEENRKLKQLVA